MSRFADIIEFIIKEEGGYINHPDDPGGETKFGISKRSYPNLDIKNLTRQQAEMIYRQDFWERTRINLLPTKIAACVLDAAINNGSSRAIRWMQHILSVNVDGRIGQQTLLASNKCDINEFVVDYNIMREDFFLSLPHFDRFGKGWRRRLFRLHGFIEREL